MKVINAPSPAAKMICGEQKEIKGVKYRKALHTVALPCPDGTLLFHTLTGELLLLGKNPENREYRSGLIKKRFLVPEDFDDLSFADKAFEVARMLKRTDGRVTDFTLLTTTDCNARCYYCYEAGAKKIDMSEQTALDVAGFIKDKSRGSAVSLRFFGGEPLYNLKAIDIICSSLREKGVYFTSVMITNGYYLRGEALEKAVKLWYLKKVQITLDGRADAYNRVKAYKEGGNAYERVLENIESARRAGIEVFIRLNVGSDNLFELNLLSDELLSRFGGKKGIFVYPSLISDFNKNGRFSAGYTDADGFLKLKARLAEISGKPVVPKLDTDIKVNSCKADNDASAVILPDGRLCKCDHELYNDCFGSIYNKVYDTDDIKSWKERVRLPECASCPLYPRCLSLKKCPLVSDSCTEQLQTIRKNSLYEQITAFYNEWKEGSL